MKRKFIIFWTMIMALFLMLTACSGSVPKDSDVEEDIRTFGKGKILDIAVHFPPQIPGKASGGPCGEAAG